MGSLAGRYVSILVLLDLGLEQIKTRCLPQLPEFQSLFCWILGWNSLNAGWYLSLSLVSILVLMDLGLEHNEIWHRNYRHRRFQSLFCWILGWNCFGELTHAKPISFNPCSAGSWVGTQEKKEPRKNKKLFSFNPCSAGSWVGT